MCPSVTDRVWHSCRSGETFQDSVHMLAVDEAGHVVKATTQRCEFLD